MSLANIKVTVAGETKKINVQSLTPKVIAVRVGKINQTTGITPVSQEFAGQTLVTVTHNRDRFPEVQVLDSDGNQTFAAVKNTSRNEFEVRFNSAQSGTITYI